MKKIKLFLILLLCHYSSYANIEADDVSAGLGQMIGWIALISIAFFIIKAIFGGRNNDASKEN